MRQSARWVILGFGLLALSALAVVVIVALIVGGGRVPGRSVLLVRLAGSIPDLDTRSSVEQAIGGEIDTLPEIVGAIERAAEDDRIRAIRLEVASSDLGWGKAQEIREVLEHFRTSGKPVYGYIEAAGTLEYYLASVADHLSMPPAGMMMATGLLADAMFFRGALDKLRITPDFEAVGEYKSAGDRWMRDSMSEADRTATESVLDSLYTQIVDDVAESRDIPTTQVTRAIDAGMLTPEEAREAGLLDDLLYKDEVEDQLHEEVGDYTELRVRSYKKSGRMHLIGGKRIAIVHATGVIVTGRSGKGAFGGEFLGSDSLVETLRRIREDSGIRAVVLRVDSPGGSGTASDIIWRETQLLRAEKPLVVSMGDVAASGGYYISMGAHAIVADPGTITGSIGVVSGKFNLRGLYEEWLGLKREQIKRGENAGLYSDYEGFTDSQRARLRTQMEEFYRGFVRKAAEGRGKKDDEIDGVARGRIWTGAQAREIGLVDELGGLTRAVEIARERAGIAKSERVILESYPRGKTFFELFSEGDETTLRLGARLPEGIETALSGIEIQERISREGPILWIGEIP